MEKGLSTPHIFTADEAAFRHPPPTYEEVMGVYQTSVKPMEQTTEMPPLAYIDIMPKCLKAGNIAGKVIPTFDDFSAIVAGANCWLQDNPGLSVWKCETIVRKLTQGKDGTLSYELNEMLRHDSTFGFIVYIKGIRLWLMKKISSGPPQQLGIKTVVPEKVTIEIPMSKYGSGYGVIKSGTEVIQNFRTHTYTVTTFDGLEDTIKKLQTKLKNEPIQGTVLTIETDNVKAFEGLQRDFNPESTCWSENKDKSQRNTQVIRIFYVKGSPTNEELGYTEIIPDVKEQPDSAVKPGKFETFDNVISSLSQWVSANNGLRVVNIQQNDAYVKRNFLSGQLTVTSDSTDDRVSSYSERRMAKILRVFYTKSASSGIPPGIVTSRLFLPARTGARAFECMTQTMERIDAWLRVTGVPIYSVETVELLFNETNPTGADSFRSDYSVQALAGKRWLTAIRVYFAGPYVEPLPEMLPPLPVYKSGSSSCTIL